MSTKLVFSTKEDLFAWVKKNRWYFSKCGYAYSKQNDGKYILVY